MATTISWALVSEAADKLAKDSDNRTLLQVRQLCVACGRTTGPLQRRAEDRLNKFLQNLIDTKQLPRLITAIQEQAQREGDASSHVILT